MLKVNIPAKINEIFRRAVSRRRGVRKGVLGRATLTAISRYAGADPRIALIASSSFISIEAPPEVVPRVLRLLIPSEDMAFTTRSGVAEVGRKLKGVEVTFEDEGYAAFKCRPDDTEALASLGNFRAEWDDRELVFEDGCMSLATHGIEESLELAGKVAPALGMTLPFTPVTNQLEIYKWREIQGQEVIIK